VFPASLLWLCPHHHDLVAAYNATGAVPTRRDAAALPPRLTTLKRGRVWRVRMLLFTLPVYVEWQPWARLLVWAPTEAQVRTKGRGCHYRVVKSCEHVTAAVDGVRTRTARFRIKLAPSAGTSSVRGLEDVKGCRYETYECSTVADAADWVDAMAGYVAT
jgi:hypothetical protein